jgi:hypothetical protein
VKGEMKSPLLRMHSFPLSSSLVGQRSIQHTHDVVRSIPEQRRVELD